MPTALARAMLGKTTLYFTIREPNTRTIKAPGSHKLGGIWGERLGGGEGGSECQCLSGLAVDQSPLKALLWQH